MRSLPSFIQIVDATIVGRAGSSVWKTHIWRDPCQRRGVLRTIQPVRASLVGSKTRCFTVYLGLEPRLMLSYCKWISTWNGIGTNVSKFHWGVWARWSIGKVWGLSLESNFSSAPPTNSYFVSTAGGAPLEEIKKYIESQKTSQRKWVVAWNVHISFASILMRNRKN